VGGEVHNDARARVRGLLRASGERGEQDCDEEGEARDHGWSVVRPVALLRGLSVST
jgi:hypothetical protein